MPYANVDESLWDKMDRCVQHVQDRGFEKRSAVAICYTTIVEGKELETAITEHETKEKEVMEKPQTEGEPAKAPEAEPVKTPPEPTATPAEPPTGPTAFADRFLRELLHQKKVKE